MNDIVVIYVVFANKEHAASVGKDAVLQSLAGCVNIIENVSSLYIWDGALQEDQECVALFKTTTQKKEALIAFINKVHTYDIPCIISYNTQSTDTFFSFLNS